MFRNREPVEVAILDERITTTYPQPNKPFYTAITTYRQGDNLPRSIFIPLSDVAKGKEEDLRKQLESKKGDLYDQFLTYRAKKIREDLEKVGTVKPETVKV
jgi:hypothetical protein